MKKACTTISDPTVNSPTSPGASPHFACADRSNSDAKIKRASSANVKRAAGGMRGAREVVEQRPRKGYKNNSPQSSGDGGDPNTAWRSEMRRGVHALRDVRNHLADLNQKAVAGAFGPEELRAATSRAAQLLREAERLQRRAAELQTAPSGSSSSAPKSPEPQPRECTCPPGYQPGDAYEPPLVHELRMLPPSSVLAPAIALRPPTCGPGALRSKSELELSRRLSESLDMQERLAADNADLDVKRYILYKELMVKEQRLETARAQAARLQAELKLLARDNARLQTALKEQTSSETTQNACLISSIMSQDTNRHTKSYEQNLEQPEQDKAASGEPAEKYTELVNQLTELEEEVRVVREMATAKKEQAGKGLCGGKPCPSAGGENICYKQEPGMPPMPPVQRDCHICPPCPASCNPDRPQTPAEKEVVTLKEKLQKSEDECKKYVAECALLRMEVLKRKEEAETERCITRDTKARLRTLEMKFEGLTPKTNMRGPADKAYENELNVNSLRAMLREANQEIADQLRLIQEMEKGLQDYRLKYLGAQQVAEEQKRHIAMLDAENVRISEQINFEIQRVKIKFQEKLQELTPLPKLLTATHDQLRDAQQQQAIAEHRTEQLARELVCARDKITVLEYKLNKPVEKPPGQDRAAEGKLLAATQQRVTQLSEENAAMKSELDRLRTTVSRMEGTIVASGKRLDEGIIENKRLLDEQEMIKKEAEKAIERAHTRTETIRKCLQTTIAELEQQLAASRAKVAFGDREREELRLNLENQVTRLQDNCELAHRRLRGLSTQVKGLKKIAPLDTKPDTRKPCLCMDVLMDKSKGKDKDKAGKDKGAKGKDAAPKSGATTPKSGATTPKSGATTPTSGATTPKTGAAPATPKSPPKK